MNEKYKNIVCFGEILWDILPDGAMPGGAPMNVAYHLKKLNHDPQLITRIGHDKWGKGLIELMERNKISTEYFQMDHRVATGRVIANIIDNSNVTYDIINPSAWDYIEWEDQFEILMNSCDHFVFGSLSARNEISRKTLFQLLELAKTKVLDINLRPPFFNKEIINNLIRRTNIVKLNSSELELITGWFTSYKSDEDRIRLIQDHFDIATVVVTNGDKGCMVIDDGCIHKHPGFPIEVADTVGSGDAFLAGFLSDLLKGSPFDVAIKHANALGALVATYKGACPEYNASDIQLLMAKNLKGSNINA